MNAEQFISSTLNTGAKKKSKSHARGTDNCCTRSQNGFYTPAHPIMPSVEEFISLTLNTWVKNRIDVKFFILIKSKSRGKTTIVTSLYMSMLYVSGHYIHRLYSRRSGAGHSVASAPLSVCTVKGKWLELSAPKLIDI